MTPSALLAALAAFAAVLVAGVGVSPTVRSARTSGRSGTSETRRLRLTLRRGSVHPGANDVAAWCDHAARALRSGASLTAAIADATALQPAMSPVTGPILRRVGRGHSLLDALDIGDAATAPGLALTVLRSCARFGGPAAAPLERAATTLRSRAAIAEEQLAQSAQAKLSARVLTLVPLALLAVLAATDPKVRSAITTPTGLTVVFVGAALNVTGAMWMRRIIGRPR